MNRRKFIQLSAISAGAALAGVKQVMGADKVPVNPMSNVVDRVGRQVVLPKSPTIAMPIGVAPLAKDALDPMFDDMRSRAGVNVLMTFSYTHETHRAGVEPSKTFHGGNYARVHMEYYKDQPLTLEDMSAPEFGGVDVLERVIPVAQKHGMKVFPFILEDNTLPALVKNWESMYEVDHHGRRANGHPGGLCYNHPRYLNFTRGLLEDYARSYDIGGIMWGSERQSGFLNALCLSQSNGQDPSKATCFCDFCLAKGRAQGIDVERARKGFGEVEAFVLASRKGVKPRDGFFTTFWRILLKYPEVLAWENLWATSRHEFQAALYQHVKGINPKLQMGWHVWQNITFSPFQRAEENLEEMAMYSDFLRPAVYNNVAGGRFVTFVNDARTTVFGDLTPQSALEVIYQQMNYSEARYDKLAATGFSAQYVEREVRRTVESVGDHPVQVWPGVDIDVPVGAEESHCTPESVGQAVTAAFNGGAQGIILSRNYTEMKPENLSGAGKAMKELGLI